MPEGLPIGRASGPLYRFEGKTPRVHPEAWIAPTAAVIGDVTIGPRSGVWFGSVVRGDTNFIRIGAGTNIQDNSLLVTNRTRGDLVIGAGVTVGHNARLGSGQIGDDALVGMGAEVGDHVVLEAGGCIGARSYVEPGTVVESGWIWAGRPARRFRELKAAEREAFARFRDVYIGYSSAYRGL